VINWYIGEKKKIIVGMLEKAIIAIKACAMSGGACLTGLRRIFVIITMDCEAAWRGVTFTGRNICMTT
jgi:hypothetical protein